MKSIILIHGPTGHAYRLEEHMGGYALLCAPLLADGSIEPGNECETCEGEGDREDRDTGAPMICGVCDGTGREDDYNWGEVDFYCIDEDQAKTAEFLRGTLALLEELA